MTNTKLLEQAITDSGLKKGYIAEQLAISRFSLASKINGTYEFKQGEIATMCKILNIAGEKKEKIFFSLV